jgi:hypothetical protein
MDKQPAQEVTAEEGMAAIGNTQTQMQNLHLQSQAALQALQQQQPVAAVLAP